MNASEGIGLLYSQCEAGQPKNSGLREAIIEAEKIAFTEEMMCPICNGPVTRGPCEERLYVACLSNPPCFLLAEGKAGFSITVKSFNGAFYVAKMKVNLHGEFVAASA